MKYRQPHSIINTKKHWKKRKQGFLERYQQDGHLFSSRQLFQVNFFKRKTYLYNVVKPSEVKQCSQNSVFRLKQKSQSCLSSFQDTHQTISP